MLMSIQVVLESRSVASEYDDIDLRLSTDDDAKLKTIAFDDAGTKRQHFYAMTDEKVTTQKSPPPAHSLGNFYHSTNQSFCRAVVVTVYGSDVLEPKMLRTNH